jgi:hypothetical protein
MSSNIDSFVYCWTDTSTNKLYVGFHKGAVDDGYICSSKHMKKEYAIRAHDFTRQVIANGTYDDCRTLEKKIILAMFTQNVPCYNLNAGGVIKFTPEIRAKISATHKGKIISQSHRDALRAYSKVKPPASEETREKIRQSKLGVIRKPFTEEAKRNMSIARTGVKRAPEVGVAISLRQLGTKRKNPYPEAAKEKNRIASTGKKHSEETIARLKEIKANVSQETRDKLSAAKKAYWDKKRAEQNDTKEISL